MKVFMPSWAGAVQLRILSSNTAAEMLDSTRM